MTGTKYSPEIFWLQSTATDRTKMSALLEAAALWQLNNSNKFLSESAWEPTSLNFQTRDTDNVRIN
jgi:prostatic aicd phosphatase